MLLRLKETSGVNDKEGAASGSDYKILKFVKID